jgi:epoxyqueuosine reductase
MVSHVSTVALNRIVTGPLSTHLLTQLARESKFDLCGFARAERIPPEFLVPWLEAGLAATMDWMGARALERLDVSRLLPGARTVVSLACNYYFADSDSSSPVARYARGRDYHATLHDRLRNLRQRIADHYPGLRTYASVDTGPIMEKVWASRAGLGYVGRNGCFITEEFGSYVLLATLLLDEEVDRYAAGPAMDRCGTCNLCVSSCPTEAIVADATVDARRCLSYQTIENRGECPEALRPALEGMVFGCDICQDVCPLNLSPVAADARFAPRAVAQLGVLEIAALTPEQYRALVPGTALARAKYDGLRRNAIYALGAVRELRASALLEKLCTDPSDLVRGAAQWALSRIQDGERGAPANE